jgi:predicted ATPase/class 3 adenylate cyclase/DNA-binding SARP family transcriptional activator
VADLPVSLSLLGPMEVVRAGAPARLGSPQQRRLLAVLAIRANDVVPSDRLADVLWGDEPPESEAHTLHALVSRLRRGPLGPEAIETVAPGYRLRVDCVALDTLQFEELVREGLAAVDRPKVAAVSFETALKLWRGRPYAEFADEEFASAEVARLAELRLCAVEEHATALVELGRAGEVIPGLEAEIEAEPFRERLRAVLMTAMARAGRPVEALRAFDAYRRVLADEVGVTPSPALHALNDDILRQHPDLGWDRPSGSGPAAHEELPTGTVTFLFTDLEGSTRLWEEQAEAMAGALARHDAILRDAVEEHGGVVVKTTGDGVHAVFANASHAVAAAIAAQLALHAEPWPEATPLRVRMGVHTGEANQRDGDYYGPALNQAARLMGIAHGGQIVCSGLVADLAGSQYQLEDLGLHRLRDVESALRVFQVNAPGLESRFPPLASLDADRSNLPRELSGFVGRADDVTGVVKALAETRVVSIVGVGGVGKTRLALRVGGDLRADYTDGVWWCELSGVRDPGAIADAVAAALGYAPPQGASTFAGLAQFFRHKQLLLVLDNCEHLLSAAGAFVRAMGESAPQLSVLATSREALGIHGERTYPLPALELPADASPFSVESSESGALFAIRASDARGSFLVTDENAAAIAEVCAHLDGNALAIELAAARTTVMSPAEIRARLDQRFRLLKTRGGDAAERHQTLHAAIDWSYDLLDPEEQALLQWLSVFVGDFDLSAATAVAAGTGLEEFDAVDRLASLVAKSLVERSETEGISRYRLLETIREYAAERLGDEGSEERARHAHAAHYLAEARELRALLDTARDFEALEQLRVDTPNLAAGLRWLIASDRVADVLGYFDDAGAFDTGMTPFVLQDELGRVADEALRQPGTSGMRGYVAAQLYSGMRGFMLGDWERQRHAVAAAEAVDPASPMIAGMAMGAAALQGDLAGGMAIGRAGVERARGEDNPRGLAFLLSLLAFGEMALDPDQALAHVEEAVEIARACRATSALVYPLCQLSVVLADRGTDADRDRALAAAEECIRLDRSHRKVWSTLSEFAAAKLRVDRGEFVEGLRLWSDVLHRLDWAGEVAYFTMQLPALAEATADTDPTVAVDLAAIAGSGVIAPFPMFEVLQSFGRLASVIDESGPDTVAAARSRAASMSYDAAVAYVFDNVERLIAEAEAVAEAE